MYAHREATIRTGHGTMDGFQTGKGVCQSCILLPHLFNFYLFRKPNSASYMSNIIRSALQILSLLIKPLLNIEWREFKVARNSEKAASH